MFGEMTHEEFVFCLELLCSGILIYGLSRLIGYIKPRFSKFWKKHIIDDFSNVCKDAAPECLMCNRSSCFEDPEICKAMKDLKK